MLSRLCLCNRCGQLHSNCPFEMSLVEDIINEVGKRPELWLTKHPNFRNTKLKGKLWKGISAKLNIEGDLLKKHWKYLKSQFKKELTKPFAGSSDSDDQQVSSWQYFNQLSFLREEFEEPRGDLPVSVVREEIVVSGELPVPFMRENSSSFCDLPSNHLQETSETGSISTPLQDPEDINLTLPTPSMPSTSMKTRQSADSRRKNSMKLEHRKPEVMLTELRGDQDEEFYYLMSILPTMKRLTTVQKMRFRSKIEQYLLEAIIINEHSSYMNNFSPNNSLPGGPQGNRKRKYRSRI